MLTYPTSNEKDAVRQLHRKYILVFVAWLILLGFVVAAYSSEDLSNWFSETVPNPELASTALVSLTFVTFVLLLLFNTWLHKKAEGYFFKQFAVTNQFDFSEKGDFNTLTGAFFTIGGRREMTAVVSGTYSESPFRLFNYQADLTPGSKSPSFVTFTALELTVSGMQIPSLLLISQSAHLFGGYEEIVTEGRLQRLHLEGDFDEHFSAYVTPGEEVLALQILSPDVMQTLIENEGVCNIEFIGDRVYLSTTRLAEDTEALKRVFSCANFLIQYEFPRLTKVHN